MPSLPLPYFYSFTINQFFMKQINLKVLRLLLNSSLLFLLFTLFITPGCKKIQEQIQDLHNNPKVTGNFQQVNLVANNEEYGAAHVDTLLLNAWGLAFSPTGIAWVSAEAGHVST